jgi:tetratricopeptide (TPR) repeat protein
MSARSVLTAILFLTFGASAAQAQATFEIVGKITDAEGNGLADVRVAAWNTAFPEMKRDTKSGKKGNFFLSGLLYNQQKREWEFSFESEGLAPRSMKVVARMGDRTIYNEFERAFGPGESSFRMPVMGIGEIRIDITMGDPGAAAVPGAPEAAAAGEAAVDPWAVGNQKLVAGDFQGSVEWLEKAVEAAPDDAERRELLARVFLKLDRSSEALNQARKATKTRPDRVSAHLLLADIHASRGETQYAYDAIAEARRLEPANRDVLQRVAWLATDLGKPEEAIAAYEEIVAAKPDDTESWLALGDLYSRAGMPEKASAAFERVTELDPGNAFKTFFNLGALIENRPNLTPADNRKAIEAFRKSVEINPNYGPGWRHLAYSQLRSGDLAGARASFERYLEVDPEAKDAREIRETIKSLPAPKK